jgi:hypothetical protein
MVLMNFPFYRTSDYITTIPMTLGARIPRDFHFCGTSVFTFIATRLATLGAFSGCAVGFHFLIYCFLLVYFDAF